LKLFGMNLTINGSTVKLDDRHAKGAFMESIRLGSGHAPMCTPEVGRS
jgi:hypothetical protein